MSRTLPSTNIRQIFDTMEYGSVQEGKSLGQAWLKENVESFGFFVGGKLTKSEEGKGSTIDVSTGVDNSVKFSLHSPRDYSMALSASESAFQIWSSLEGHSRASILYSIARQLQKHITLLCEVEALSRGVQVGNSREYDVPTLIRTFYYYAGWAQLVKTDLPEWKPCGPVIGVTSTSSPLSSLALMIAPALAAGNTITLLPHVSNCLSAFLIAQLCASSGVPPGVVNVVPQNHTDEEKCPAFFDSIVKKLAVIGSPSFVRSVISSSDLLDQDNLSLLKSYVPMIILDSADINAAVDCVIDASWINQGQDPWAVNLLIVEESVYLLMKSKLSDHVRSLKTGDAFEKMVDVSDTAVDKSLAERLKEVLTLVHRKDVVQPVISSSARWSPTVIFPPAPLSNPVLTSSDVWPVLQVVSARSAKEAVNIANHYGGGMAASVWTENSALSWECSRNLKASTVWINTCGSKDASIPIAGQNSSGNGCFFGKEGILEYLQPSTVSCLLSKEESSSAYPFCHTNLLPVYPEKFDIDQTYKFFYGGGHKRPSSNSYKTVLDSRKKIVAVVPEANRKDARNAVEAALKAQSSWWKRDSHNRAQIIYNLAEKLSARQSHFAKSLLKLYENVTEERCLQEIYECEKLLFHYAAICDKASQSSSQFVNEMCVHVIREPLGVVAVALQKSTHYCFASLIALIGCAISYGNTCVAVVDMECSLPALELALLLEASEVPAGVINILSGDLSSLLPTLCGHMDINSIWFSGCHQSFQSVIKSESTKSNLKQSWVMEQVLDPYTHRLTYERRASQTKAMWFPTVASFGA
ncbi:Aldehyde dehydrogenase family 16 member A1 [Frankliniella fusca]|uniref:Aldehyde dehydrogenase family 16 member A1 n=1 Tax=Frankliniella fusca TaxID=407009 RepID=A0AAE1LML6_9NEOP|nr:Aldehyde dehydrogenase family 16 member A1 [Frankliniella fusca]